jgi:protein TonB
VTDPQKKNTESQRCTMRCFADMNATSNGRVIRIAIAGSLAVHFIIAILVHPPTVEAQPQEKISPADIVHLIPPKPTPTPRVTPPKPQTQKQTQARRPFIDRLILPKRNDKTKGIAIAIPSAAPGTPEPYDYGTPGPDVVAPTGAPASPAPTPKPACSAPDVPARTTFVEPPAVSDTVSQTGQTAKIRVDLDADGSVRGVSVYVSTGSMELDQAALAAARQSRYAAEQIDCKNVPGSYLFTVEFQ